MDRVGDRLRPGSFTQTLRDWRASGKRLPVVWSRQTSTPDSVIGSADPNEVRETTAGLRVDGQLDIGESSVAKRAWELLKSGAVSSWSFGYIPTKQKRGRDGVNDVFEVELLEVGPTLSPANPATATIGVKDLSAVWLPERLAYDDQQWADACVLDRADCSDEWLKAPAKQRYALPITDPGADEPNPVALAPTAAALADPTTLGNVCDKAIELAKARLLSAYDELEMDLPESLQTSSYAPLAKSAAPVTIYSFPAS